MKVRVLGSSAGGGFPQWNCNCANCKGFRVGRFKAPTRTQSSIAVSSDEQLSFALLNASPDIGAQLKGWPKSQPGRAVRDSIIAGVILVDSQIDHCVGLLSLREAGKLKLFCTEQVYQDLTAQLPLLTTLQYYLALEHHFIPLEDEAWGIDGVEGLGFRAHTVAGKSPPYCHHENRSDKGHNIAIEITDLATGKSVLYAPGLQKFDNAFERLVARVDCVLIDGTFWTDDEMAREGISKKTAYEMGHLHLSGTGGMIEQLQKFPEKRRILIHINNTNPILNPDSVERRLLDEMGIEVAFDGMEIEI